MQCFVKGKQPSLLTNTVSVSGLFTIILLASFLDAIAALRIINYVLSDSSQFDCRGRSSVFAL